MKIKDAKELQEFINSIRKKAFEDVASLITSDAVEKDPYGNILISQDGLIRLIQSIDTAKTKKQKEEAEAEFDNLA